MMDEVLFDPAQRRRFWTGLLTCALAQIAIAVLVIVVEPNTLRSASRGILLVFILGVLPAGIVSAFVRWLIERRLGKVQFAGAWAAAVRAKFFLLLAQLVALPLLALAVFVAWLTGGPASELGRALFLLLIASGIISVTGTLVANLINLSAPRPRAS
jgi:hypothetical protein